MPNKKPRIEPPNFLKGKLDDWETKPRLCLMCPTKLPPYLKYYCCGMCINAAKMAGIYGKEQEQTKS